MSEHYTKQARALTMAHVENAGIEKYILAQVRDMEAHYISAREHGNFPLHKTFKEYVAERYTAKGSVLPLLFAWKFEHSLSGKSIDHKVE